MTIKKLIPLALGAAGLLCAAAAYAGGDGQRRMAGGGDFLNYSITDDTSADWDQTATPPTAAPCAQPYANFTSAATAVTHTPHGTLPKDPDVSIGSYTETVKATV